MNPLVVLLFSAFMQHQAQQQAADRQQALLSASADEANRINEAGLKKTLALSENYTIQANKTQGEAARLFETYMRPIEQDPASAGSPSHMGNAYLAARAAAASNTLKEAKALAQALAKGNAAGVLRSKESIEFGRTASEVAQLRDAARGAANVGQLAARGVQPDPWLTLGGKLMGAYALGSMMKPVPVP